MLRRAIAAALVALTFSGFAAVVRADEPVTLRVALPGTTTTMPNWTDLWGPWSRALSRMRTAP